MPADAANVRPRAWFSTRTFTESLAAQLRQLFALGVAQPCCCAEAFGYAAHQAVGALVVVSDAVAGEHPANQARRIRRAKSYAEPSRRRPGNSVAQALHEHQRLALMAHARSQRFDADIQVEMTLQGRYLAKISTCCLASFMRPNRIFAIESYYLPP